MEYITKKPPQKPETQLKLIQVCKYFFFKHPIIPISSIKFKPPYYSITAIDNSETLQIVWDIFALKYQLWIVDLFECDQPDRELEFLPYVYQIDIKFIQLKILNIPWSEWKALVASNYLEHVQLEHALVTYDGGQSLKAPLEDIVASLPNTIKSFQFESFFDETYTTDTFSKIAELPEFPNLETFHIRSINCPLNPADLITFIEKNPSTDYLFGFAPDYPDVIIAQLQTALLYLYNEYRANGKILKMKIHKRHLI